jgi:hypothetical protein
MATFELARELLQRASPAVELRPQAVSDWRGDFALPDGVAEYFTELGPVDVTIEAYGNPYFLPSLARLWSHQLGYRVHGITHERIVDWDDDWLVIADEGADPFIYSRSQGAILRAFHGEGVWEPDGMFDNLAEMVTVFAIIGDVVASAGHALTDADSMILERHRNEAQRRIAEFTGSHDTAATILSSLGWG